MFCAFAILGVSSSGAYAICPYIGSQKINAFSGNTVGVYCIRPPDVPFMERITLKIDRPNNPLSPAGPFGRAYAIRPYPNGRKMWCVWEFHLR